MSDKKIKKTLVEKKISPWDSIKELDIAKNVSP
jgi:hypothetical protein